MYEAASFPVRKGSSENDSCYLDMSVNVSRADDSAAHRSDVSISLICLSDAFVNLQSCGPLRAIDACTL